MQKLITSTLLAFAVIAFSGCTVVAKLPMTRFETPETEGKFLAAEGQIGYQGRSEVEFTDDFTVIPPSTTNPSVETPGHRIMANGSLGILNRLDVNLTIPEARLGLKYQFLGAPRTMAEKGNFSAAVSAGISGNDEEETGSPFLSSAVKTYKLHERQYDFALIGGWRFAENLMLYGGPFIVFDKVKTTYTPAPGATAQESSGTIRSLGGNFGVQVMADKNLFVRLEGAGANTKLGNANITNGTYGLSAGMYF